MNECDPATGQKWKDRHGVAYGANGLRHTGNVEQYLNYSKLHRTGRLLRGLNVRRLQVGNKQTIELYNKTPYASDHEEGGSGNGRTLKQPYVNGGASGVVFGGDVVARPSMKPSKQVLQAPYKLFNRKLKELKW